jgi:hypothetical protein
VLFILTLNIYTTNLNNTNEYVNKKLITRASTGFGNITAKLLVEKGHTGYAITRDTIGKIKQKRTNCWIGQNHIRNLFRLILFLVKWVILRSFSPKILLVALLRFVHFGSNVIKSTPFFLKTKSLNRF